jgi:hypothetical protein
MLKTIGAIEEGAGAVSPNRWEYKAAKKLAKKLDAKKNIVSNRVRVRVSTEIIPFDQLQPNPHLQTVSALKTALSNEDNCTDNKYGRKSKSGSLSDTCITCKYLKEDLGFDNAVNHPAHEPCPVLNLEVWKTYFKKHPVVRSDRSSTSARQQSTTSNPRGTKPMRRDLIGRRVRKDFKIGRKFMAFYGTVKGYKRLAEGRLSLG